MFELAHIIKEIFQRGGSIKRASGGFNGVWSEMGVGSTNIRDAKSSGGIVGLTRKQTAALRWTVTRQFLGEYSSSFHYGLGPT